MQWRQISFLFGGILVGLLLGGGVIYGYTRLTARHAAPVLGVSSPAPEFSLASTTGEQVKLSGTRGRPVLLNFWATWCPPCKEEMPLLQKTSEKYPDLLVLAVDNDEAADIVRKFVEANHLTFSVLLDPGGAVNNLYQLRGYPTSYFIDSNGTLRAIHIGQLTEEILDRNLMSIGVNIQ